MIMQQPKSSWAIGARGHVARTVFPAPVNIIRVHVCVQRALARANNRRRHCCSLWSGDGDSSAVARCQRDRNISCEISGGVEELEGQAKRDTKHWHVRSRLENVERGKLVTTDERSSAPRRAMKSAVDFQRSPTHLVYREFDRGLCRDGFVGRDSDARCLQSIVPAANRADARRDIGVGRRNCQRRVVHAEFSKGHCEIVSGVERVGCRKLHRDCSAQPARAQRAPHQLLVEKLAVDR